MMMIAFGGVVVGSVHHCRELRRCIGQCGDCGSTEDDVKLLGVAE